MSYTEFDKRMKNYEAVYINKLVPHVPIIIRIDGKAFHKFTEDRNYIEKYLEDIENANRII